MKVDYGYVRDLAKKLSLWRGFEMNKEIKQKIFDEAENWGNSVATLSEMFLIDRVYVSGLLAKIETKEEKPKMVITPTVRAASTPSLTNKDLLGMWLKEDEESGMITKSN
jgi:hypothetical protein